LDAFNPDDQLANLKNWWKQYGNLVLLTVDLDAITGFDETTYRTSLATSTDLVPIPC